MRILDIFCVHFLSADGKKLSIGGIETYIYNIINLAEELNISVRVFQKSNEEFKTNYHSAMVYGIKYQKKDIFNELYSWAIHRRTDGDCYVNLIASDLIIPNRKVPNSIVIQHGIAFDGMDHKKFLISFLNRCFYSYRRINRIQNVDIVVCVDNNYICWYRTQTPKRDVKLIPIMNFTRIPEFTCRKEKKENEVIRIVFARRFVKVRGTRLFAPVAKRLLDKYKQIEIAFAGEGPEELYLKNMFIDEGRISFSKFITKDSLAFHQQFDIAVVPTIFSEGTSLSLLEAMAAGCAVVCTNVGGMTNIILDGYNGLMTRPDPNELYEALSRMIEDKDLRQNLSKHAIETVSASFSLEKWKSKWTKVLFDKFNNIDK